MPHRFAISLAVALLIPIGASAHDYWLEPETFFPPVSKAVNVRLHVGEHLTSEAERPFQRKPTVRFQLLAIGVTEDLARSGKDGETPAAHFTPAKPGGHLIVLDRSPQLIKLEADRFNKYLAVEGLDAILNQRRKAGEEQKDGRERYSRYLKCLLQSGTEQDETFRRVLGQKLELVPQADPYRLKVGDQLPVQVLFDGKPLAGVRVAAYHRADGKPVEQVHMTTAEGLVQIKLERSGTWLVRLVHMRRCEEAAAADWESYWGAYTFGVK